MPRAHHRRLAACRSATDPTPTQAVALRLMHLDSAPSVLVGRPCYHELKRSAECTPGLWTHARYSSTVVASMLAVIEVLARGSNSTGVVLIGYSGGGALAMLIAER